MLFRSGLEAFLAEHGTPLGGPERHGGLPTARRTVRHRFHPLPRGACAGRASGPLGLTRLAALGFVPEVLVGEELLFSRRPDEFRAAVY